MVVEDGLGGEAVEAVEEVADVAGGDAGQGRVVAEEGFELAEGVVIVGAGCGVRGAGHGRR